MRITLGTKEFLVVDVSDKLDNIDDLAGTNATFDVLLEDETVLLENQTALVDGMRVFCLVDTTAWDEGDYMLYLKFNIAPEIPRLGPLRFSVTLD